MGIDHVWLIPDQLIEINICVNMDPCIRATLPYFCSIKSEKSDELSQKYITGVRKYFSGWQGCVLARIWRYDTFHGSNFRESVKYNGHATISIKSELKNGLLFYAIGIS